MCRYYDIPNSKVRCSKFALSGHTVPGFGAELICDSEVGSDGNIDAVLAAIMNMMQYNDNFIIVACTLDNAKLLMIQ